VAALLPLEMDHAVRPRPKRSQQPESEPSAALLFSLACYSSVPSALKNGCGPSTVPMGTKWVTRVPKPVPDKQQ
jgi:hypothetical protein